MAEPVGLIAGEGRLPVLVAEGIRAAGRQVACVGMAGLYDPRLEELADHIGTAGVVQLGRWVKLLRGWGVTEAVMVGRVRKTLMYDPMFWFRLKPDWRTARVWLWRTRSDRRTDSLLCAVADELAMGGVRLMDTTLFIRDHMAPEGVLSQRRPGPVEVSDIREGWPVVLRMGELDIGQSIAIKSGKVIAVEAIDGTDAMIRRVGSMSGSAGWVMIKVAKPQQDLRFDVPTVGVQTLDNLKAAGCSCLAVEAGKVIVVDRPAFLKKADEMGFVVAGVAGANLR